MNIHQRSIIGGMTLNYVTSTTKANEWGISKRRVAIFCKEGRVPGALLISNRWFLPSNATKPLDPRKKKDSANHM